MYGVLLKLTRTSLISAVLCALALCHYWLCWPALSCWEKVENLNPETRVHWPQQYQQSAAQCQGRETFIEKQNKGIWLRNYAMIWRCWQPLLRPVSAWWGSQVMAGLEWSQLPALSKGWHQATFSWCENYWQFWKQLEPANTSQWIEWMVLRSSTS